MLDVYKRQPLQPGKIDSITTETGEKCICIACGTQVKALIKQDVYKRQTVNGINPINAWRCTVNSSICTSSAHCPSSSAIIFCAFSSSGLPGARGPTVSMICLIWSQQYCTVAFRSKALPFAACSAYFNSSHSFYTKVFS